MQINKDDHYCYCSDMLVEVEPAQVLNTIATGENHSTWASSQKRELSEGFWTGTSYFTGEDSIVLRFDADYKRNTVDFMIRSPEQAPEAMRMMTWARALPGELIGYKKGSSILGLYQPRFADQELDAFLRDRFLHASEMYRIKALAEQNAVPAANALPCGEYLATASELIHTPVERLFEFVSDAQEYGKWTWGRAQRTQEDKDTLRCPQQFGGPDLLLRLDIDAENLTVDYYLGEDADSMLLRQSARVFPGTAFDYDEDVSLVTFTRWRAAGQSAFEWDRAELSQIIEARMTKSVLERG